MVIFSVLKLARSLLPKVDMRSRIMRKIIMIIRSSRNEYRPCSHLKKRVFSGYRIIHGLPVLTVTCLIIGLICMSAPARVSADVQKVSYLYTLSNFNGPVSSHWANIYIDKKRKDIYVVDPRERDVRIFDENGMEVFLFADDGRFGTISDLTVDGEGNIIILSKQRSGHEINVADYRGEPQSKIELRDLPPEYSDFRPDRIVWHDRHLYLVDTGYLRIAVISMDGTYKRGYDIASLLKIPEKDRAQNEISGFSIDGEGGMLFTVSVLFQAYRLTPEGAISSFGRSGGGPGTFGVVSGIASDDRGNIYVSDRLRCVVMVFNKDFEFLTEFGYRGHEPANLIVPNDISVDSDGKLYVAQARERGVSVFAISYE